MIDLARDLANKVQWLFEHLERENERVSMATAGKLIEVRDAEKAFRQQLYEQDIAAEKAKQAACEHQWKTSENTIPPYDYCAKCHLSRSAWKPQPMSNAPTVECKP